jgi:hypothetical protein
LEDEGAGLRQLVSTLRRIPPDTLEVLLDSEQFFCDLDFPDSPVDVAERRSLVGDMKWGVFTTIARVAVDLEFDPDGVAQRLAEITGFEPLWEVLNTHFIERGHILRCYRIASDAQEVLNEIRYTHVPQLRKGMRGERDLLDRFVGFIHRTGGDPTTARELEDFVRSHLDVERRVRELETLHAELDAELGGLLIELLEYNEDFEVLQKLEGSGDEFSAAELAELRPLLGLYGDEVAKRLPPGAANAEYAGWRQMYWGNRRAQADYDTVEYAVAVRAYTRYGLILDEILSGSGA